MGSLLEKISGKLKKRTDNSRFNDQKREKIVGVFRIILVVVAILSLGALIAQYGFFLSSDQTGITNNIIIVSLYCFLFYTLFRLFLSEKYILYIKNHLFDLIISIIIILYIVFPRWITSFFIYLYPSIRAETITSLYVAISQILVLFQMSIGLIRYSRKLMLFNIQPSLLILLSFLILVLAGCFLLQLPRATNSHQISFIDALFTSTSAVCVTGLTVVDTQNYFSPLGQFIILILIQIGGLGIMTLTTFFAFIMGGSTRLKEYSTLQSLLGEENLGKIRSTIFIIAFSTFIIESFGAIALYQSLDSSIFKSNIDRIFFAIFHSVSAFCNAGFSLLSENISNPSLQFNYGLLFTIMILIVLGGLGFPVISNIIANITSFRKIERLKNRLNLHSKIVLITTFILIVIGTFMFFLLEYNNTLKHYSITDGLISSLFHSISARTAGFNSIDLGKISVSASFILIILMWIGASPASTGGGIKTTSIALALLKIRAIASGRERIEIFKKQISETAVVRAFSTILISILLIAVAQFILLMTENAKFEDLLFEVVSAFATVGLSRGITPQLSVFGKFVIVVVMFIGRIGLLTTLFVVIRKKTVGKYEYTQENILVI
jgi:trk system potassium uptake protein